MRATCALVVALLLSVVVVPPAHAAGDDLAAARRRANQAAAALADAQSRRAELETEVEALSAELTAGEQRLATLSTRVRDVAVSEFMGAGGEAGVPILDADGERRAAFVSYVTGADADAVDEYLAAAEDLRAQRDALAARQAEMAGSVEALDRRADEAVAELARLEQLEAERQEAARQEAARQEAARQEAARQEAARTPAASSPSASSPSASRGGEASPSPSPPSPSPRASSPAVIDNGGDWLCPVAGARAFSNDWGQPRSGGRRHQGTDVLSPRGTPVVASVSGTVRAHSSSLGGVSYYLAGDDGTTYFGTHLDSLSGASGRVEQGTVLGYIGNTGNARGGPTHLHFEIHPGGGAPVNPYPTLARYC